MSKNNDPLLANLNAFKNKVKSAPVVTTKSSTPSSNGSTTSPRKRLASQRENGKKTEVKVESARDEEDLDDEDEDGSPSKKVRPGSSQQQLYKQTRRIFQKVMILRSCYGRQSIFKRRGNLFWLMS